MRNAFSADLSPPRRIVSVLRRAPASISALFCALALLWAMSTPAAAGGIGLLAGDCPPKGMPQCGDPINIASGYIFEEFTDYESAGPNKLVFARFHNTEISGEFLLRTWTSTYDRYLSISASEASASRPDGKSISFFPDGANWKGPSVLDIKLTRSGANWLLTDWDETVETYTPYDGTRVRLTAIKARNGYTQTLSYNATNQLISVADTYGRILTFTYEFDFVRFINSVTTPDGLVIRYTYGGAGQPAYALTGIAYSTNPATSQRLVYQNTPGGERLTEILDENGRRISSWTYTDTFNYYATSSQRAGGVDLTKIAYDDSRTRTVTNALGQREVYKFSFISVSPGVFVPVNTEINRLATATTAAATRRFTYDANGYLASETDWIGTLTRFVNNLRGLPTQIIEAADTPLQKVTAITYHSRYRLPVRIVEPGLTTTYTYDSLGNLLKLSETDTLSSPAQTRTWTFTWSRALLTSIKDPRGNLTKYSFDASGALITSTNALGHVSRVTQHTPGGLPLTLVDANGVTTRLAYDARSRLTGETLETAAGPRVTTYSYDKGGNLLGQTLPGGAKLSFAYDTANRLIRISDLFGQKIAYVLNKLGEPTLTETGTVSTVLRRRSAAYDALGRQIALEGGAGQRTTFGYDGDGNATAIAAPLGRTTAQLFDARGRPVQITDPAGGVSEIAYDAQSRPVRISDPKGGMTDYLYNGFGEVVQAVSPDTGRTTYRYDLAGNLVGETDARGYVTSHAYDALNRPTATTYSGAAAESVTYRYDEAAGGFGIGRLTSVTDAAGTQKLVYDERGAIVRDTRVVGAQTLATQYGYDAAGRIAAIVYPSGYAATYARDAMGRTSSVALRAPGAASAQPVVSTATYQPFGPVKRFVYGNGVVETASFDRDYRQTKVAAAGQAALQNLTYAYNAADDVVSIADAVSAAQNQSFTYDALDRLTGAAGSYGTLGYGYDANGNRLSETKAGAASTYSYGAGGNRLLTVKRGATTVRSFAYTANGNVATDTGAAGASRLAYNRANRLASVARPGQPVSTYKYDAFGQRRSAALAGGGTTLFHYDLSGRLLEESQPGGRRFDTLYFDDRPVARVDVNTGALFFLHDDRLGTPQLATNAAQAVVWRAAYQPFGAATPSGPLNQPLRFPGQYADPTGLNQNGFRDYDPSLGRYLESDPIGLGGGLNTYAYVGGNPLSFVDPSGLELQASAGGISGKAGAGFGGGEASVSVFNLPAITVSLPWSGVPEVKGPNPLALIPFLTTDNAPDSAKRGVTSDALGALANAAAAAGAEAQRRIAKLNPCPAPNKGKKKKVDKKQLAKQLEREMLKARKANNDLADARDAQLEKIKNDIAKNYFDPATGAFQVPHWGK